ncbi:hypothetical protein K8354_14065 [Polaribacter litorisediminis]|uniref:hypothetical protein n=1 Tax=Polaribacter litorisediminis TaxID=1908341 RepID=UPI001CC0FE34|nr:hypothetical protein [Polaribacter litorisediminis]UAM97433.1 hypothetical protein K8354_14065 [Polaribacter litorisediminis]
MLKKISKLFIITLCIISCSQDANDVTSNSEFTDGQGGSMATFSLKGSYLYTVDYSNLSVFNIENATNPVKVNSINVGFDIETLFSFQDYLFIGSQNAMYIYDISNAELPKKMSQSDHFRACDPVVANGTNAYVTLHTNENCGGSVNELKTYDITDIENPILLNTRGLTQPKGLSLYGSNFLLVCDDSVKIFDVTDPSNSLYINEIPTTGALDIIIRNHNAFIISEHNIAQYQLDVNDITDFKKISEFAF